MDKSKAEVLRAARERLRVVEQEHESAEAALSIAKDELVAATQAANDAWWDAYYENVEAAIQGRKDGQG